MWSSRPRLLTGIDAQAKDFGERRWQLAAKMAAGGGCPTFFSEIDGAFALFNGYFFVKNDFKKKHSRALSGFILTGGERRGDFLRHREDEAALRAYLDRLSNHPREVITTVDDPDFEAKIQAAVLQQMQSNKDNG